MDTTAFVAMSAGFTLAFLWLVAAHMFMRILLFIREQIG